MGMYSQKITQKSPHPGIQGQGYSQPITSLIVLGSKDAPAHPLIAPIQSEARESGLKWYEWSYHRGHS